MTLLCNADGINCGLVITSQTGSASVSRNHLGVNGCGCLPRHSLFSFYFQSIFHI